MSLQLRLISSFLGLILLLGLLGWLGLRSLTDSLQLAVGESASAVGRSLVTVLHAARSDLVRDSGDAPPRIDIETLIERRLKNPDAAGPQREVRMQINGQVLTPEQIEALLPPGAERFDPDAVRFEVRRAEGVAALRVQGLGPELQIPLPESPVQRSIEQFTVRLLWGLAGLLLLGLLGSVLIARRLTRPLEDLATSAQALGRGELGLQMSPRGPPELRASIEAFNRMSADLSALRAEAERRREDRALAELGEIGRGLAHSLRNPLHALGLSLEALAARGDGVDTDMVATGREQLARIDQALRGFLALSAAAGAQAETVSISAVVDDVLLEASQRAAGQVRFERALAPLSLLAVPAELRILLHTLVLNALEASPLGGCVRVHTRAEADGAVMIEVDDAGEGLSAEIRARLFEPHVSSKPTGAGMGLYLSERLARQRYGGGIEFEALQPQGTRARLRLRPRRSQENTHVA
jgi:signal transduction histidine kinase